MPNIQTADEIELYYRDWGAGIPIVMIHGWPLNGDMWERQADFLASHGARVITYDRRGFGRSGQPGFGYDYDTFAADLNSLIEHLGLTEVVLVGFSMGGGEVVRYLRRYGSGRVAKAVLVSSVTPYLLKTPDNPDGIEAEEFAKIAEALRHDHPAFLREFGHKFYGRTMVRHTVSEAVLEWTQNLALTSSLRPTLESANAWATTDFREDLRSITIPVLVIHGTEDTTVPIELSATKSVSLLQNAVLTEYVGEPHGLFITASDRLNTDLLSFARGEPPAAMHEVRADEPLVAIPQTLVGLGELP